MKSRGLCICAAVAPVLLFSVTPAVARQKVRSVPPELLARIPPITVSVDPSLAPRLLSLKKVGASQRTMAKLADEHHRVASFVENEVILFNATDTAVRRFAATYGGQVTREVIPTSKESAMRSAGISLRLVHIDASRATASRLSGDLRIADPLSRGQYRVSSQIGLLTLAAAARANASGLHAGLNWILNRDSLRNRSEIENRISNPGDPTQAFIDPNGVQWGNNAYYWPYMNRQDPPNHIFSPQNIGVGEAWRLLAASGRLNNKVRVLVLDSGFKPNRDFDPSTQIVPDGTAGRPGPGMCNGTPCPFHGTDVLMAGFALADNQFGAAGPGGPVAQIVAVSSPTSGDDFVSLLSNLLRYAGALGRQLFGNTPQIINISAATPIPAGACLFVCSELDAVGSALRHAGILVVANAGNQGNDIDSNDCFIVCWEADETIPCEMSGVICVGGLAWNSTNKDPNSNWGSDSGDLSNHETVTIFAPFWMWLYNDTSMPNLMSPMPGVYMSTGTSFSAPFVAGVAALVWAANPRLGPDDVERILFETAHHSADRRVPRIVNAYGAVLDALGGDEPPFIQILSPLDFESTVFRGSSILYDAVATDSEDGNISNGIVWNADGLGQLATGSSFTKVDDFSFGSKTVTATVTDSHGFSDTDQVTVTTKDEGPRVHIINPQDGQFFNQSQDVPLDGTSFERANLPSQTLPDNEVSWQEILPAGGGIVPLFTGHHARITAGSLSLGWHTFKFIGNDGQLQDFDEHRIYIQRTPTCSGSPPTVSITRPTDGTLFSVSGDSVTLDLEGRATDQQDGNLTEGHLVWTETEDNGNAVPLGTGVSLPTAHVAFSNLISRTFAKITLTATNNHCGTAAASVNLIIDPHNL